MNNLLLKYRRLNQAEVILRQRMEKISGRLHNHRLDGGDPRRESEIEAEYEKVRDSLSDLHLKINLVRTDFFRNVRWKYERLLHDAETGLQTPTKVAEAAVLRLKLQSAENEAERLLNK